MSGPLLLEVSGLVKRFGGLVAVNNVSFAIAPGEILGLIGPNGSGKSTVMSMIMGIHRPNAGSVKVAGVEVAGWPSHRIARQGVGLVFQHSRPLHRQTVLENIRLALLRDSLFSFIPDPTIDPKARAIAERVGLTAVLDRLPSTLPFADLRRLELAKAIARHPSVILVDEPFAGLTSSETAAFARLVDDFRRDGCAVLLVDHNVKSVSALVDRVLAMYVGQPIAEGTPAAVMRDETVRRVYLGGTTLTEAGTRPPRAKTPTALHVEDLSVFYGKAQALDRVSLRVEEGELVSVIGLNGAGKTTLFNAISGLVPYTGSVRFGEGTLRGRSAAAIARGGIVQCAESRELFTDMSVRENLDLGGQHLRKVDASRQLDTMFDLFPILHKRQAQTAGTLSGGEQQMLTIARALMMQPRLLILDEPTLGLAPVILEQISLAITRLRETTPMTILLGEQNVTFALPHADRIYVLEHARVAWEGRAEHFAAEAGAAYL